MNDEGCCPVKEEMEGEGLGSGAAGGLHADSGIDGELVSEGKSLHLKPRAGDAKMDGEENKSGSKRRSKPIEVEVDSDDDEPIGSLFKLKRARKPKKVRSGLGVAKVEKVNVEKVEVRSDNSMAEDEDSGGMDDTLANFRKKLKGPKMGKDSGSGVVKRKGSSLNVEGPLGGSSNKLLKDGAVVEKIPTKVVEEAPTFGVDDSDFPSDGGLGDRPKVRGKRSRLTSVPKKKGDFDDGLDGPSVVEKPQGGSSKKKIGALRSEESFNQSSDENLEVSLSAFVRKSQSGSIRKARSSSSRKQRGSTSASWDGLSQCFGDSMRVPSATNRKSHSASASNMDCENSKPDADIKAEAGGSPIVPVPDQNDTVKSLRSDGCVTQSSEWIRDDSLMSLPASVSEVKGKMGTSDDRCNKSPEGTTEVSVHISALSKSDQGSDVEGKPSTFSDIEYEGWKKAIPERLPENCGSLDPPCEGGSEQLLIEAQGSDSASILTATIERQGLRDGLKQCSKGNASGFEQVPKRKEGVHFTDDVSDGFPLKFPQEIPSSIVQGSGEESPKPNITFYELDDVLNQSTASVQEVCNLTAIQKPLSESSPIARIELNRQCEETFKENVIQIHHSDCLNQPSESASKDLHCHVKNEGTTIYDKLVQPFGTVLENSMTSLAYRTSIPVKMDNALKHEGIDNFSDGLSEDSQLECPNQAPGISIEECHDALVLKKMEETSRSEVHTTSEVKNSNLASPLNQKAESPVTGDVPNPSSDRLVMDSSVPNEKKIPSYDASEGINVRNQDFLSVKEETNPEDCPEDGEMAPDPENKDRLSVMQRAMRKVKKRRHGDMAYEGDADWEVLMHEKSFFESNRVLDRDKPSRMKDKSESLTSIAADVDNCGAAAVAAGLKARAAGPVEKIKFKEILKRRGGFQEYLECRNLILSLWSKDITRILPLIDCGVADVPTEDETPRASLIRDVYEFLDQSGYINVGIASEKDKTESCAKVHCKILKEKKAEEDCGTGVADSEDGVAFIIGQAKSSENLTEAKNTISSDDEKLTSEATVGKKLFLPRTGSELSLLESEECKVDNNQDNTCMNAKPCNTPFDQIVEGGQNHLLDPGHIRDTYKFQAASVNTMENNNEHGDLEICKTIIVVGAGPAGLTAARHLQRQGFSVTVLEARNRIGGRVFTDHSSLSVPVDLGASIITGVEADVATERRPDPSSLICAQLGLELTVLNSDCPLYDIVTGQKVPADLDETLEAEYNSLLDDMLVLVAHQGERAMRMSLEDGLEYALKRRRMSQSITDAEDFALYTSVSSDNDAETDGFGNKTSNRTSSEEDILSPLERRVMNWHFANLEYGCAALLKAVSLPYWNQDDVYGGFGGAHCMIKGGYSSVVESLGKGLNIHFNHVVTEIFYSTRDSRESDERKGKVKVSTSNGREFIGDAVLITVPLGCLKAETIKFSPVLPEWKRSSIQRLGFGVLNKVVLEFPYVFWDDSVDYFGATAEETERRGQCFMFWNIKKTVGAPVLIALVVGKAALDGQNMSSSDHVNHAIMVLRKLFGEASVPDPVASVVTNWGKDPFSRGAYSYVAVGASGEDYDILGRPVDNCLFFAGEATCKEHPDTVGGAMMSGLREAVRIIDILRTGNDCTAEVEAMEAAQRQSDSERNEVRDVLKRLDAVEASSVLYKSSLDGAQMLTKEGLLRDMFTNTRTTAGRLHLAKELLKLPVESLKSFAGTKEGLGTLNSWILDSMGKDATQLLRHCVRLLVLVSTDLLAVRLSGIGRTVKEKVCVHTSRDIRAVASQLVSMWIEVFRKEKASNGGLKLLRQAMTSDSSKARSSKELSSGKPPLRATQGTLDNRDSVHVPSAGSHSPSNPNIKKVHGKPSKLEILAESRSEVNSSRPQVVQSLDSKVEENSVAMSEEEAAAFSAAEAARAAALAAAKAYASSEAECSTLRELPKIPSFHKFARREQYAQVDDSDLRRRKWSGGVLGRQDCISEIDSRNCRVRNWSVDFSATCANLEGSRISVDNSAQRSYSNEVAYQLNLREHSGESAAVDSSFTKAWVDTAGSEGVKDYHAIERWQSQAAAADSDFYHPILHVRDEEDSNTSSKPPSGKYERRTEETSVSQVTENRVLREHQSRGAERIKQAVVDYVASLLMPLYKAKKIDKEGYKLIMKKSATKVMEQTTDAEKAMAVSEFLDFKRKNKIRAFVDKLIERHMTMNPAVKS